jgi:hypothetical protein
MASRRAEGLLTRTYRAPHFSSAITKSGFRCTVEKQSKRGRRPQMPADL